MSASALTESIAIICNILNTIDAEHWRLLRLLIVVAIASWIYGKCVDARMQPNVINLIFAAIILLGTLFFVF